MPSNVRYAIKGSQRAENSLSRFLSRLENFVEIGPEVHRLFKQQAREAFATEGRTIGYSWRGYTGSEWLYGIIKKRMLGEQNGSRLLRWEPGNERLYPSLVDARHPEHVWRVEGKTFIFGTSVPYAYKHQLGQGRGPWWALFPSIKARPFLGVSRRTAAELRRVTARHVGI